jgi:hypothetical protein
MKFQWGEFHLEADFGSFWSQFMALIAAWLVPSPFMGKIKAIQNKGEINMSQEIVHKELGEFAGVDVKIEAGKLIASAQINLDALIDAGVAKAKAAIPGQVDDAIFDMIAAKIKEELNK